jgi:hypothetical protein
MEDEPKQHGAGSRGEHEENHEYDFAGFLDCDGPIIDGLRGYAPVGMNCVFSRPSSTPRPARVEHFGSALEFDTGASAAGAYGNGDALVVKYLGRI